MLAKLFDRLVTLYPQLVEFRRDLHMYPELSFQEENTPKKVASFLEKLGLDVRTGVGGRGVVGLLRGGKAGKTIALRADFDALPIQDEKDVSYKSKVPNTMHACGHDIHTAGLLGVAQVLSEIRDELAGNVVFIHQFAEEVTPGGAISMIEDGCLDGVDVVYGAHVWSGIPYGKIGYKDGAVMASADSFEVDILGQGGHGAQPHLAVDPLVVGSQLVLNLQQIVSRQIDPLRSAVVTVGTFQSGDAFNIIPDKAKLRGTVRTFDDDVRDYIEEAVKRVVHTTCEQSRAKGHLAYRRGYPAVVNHTQETHKVREVASAILGPQKVFEMEALMAGEDFAYYLKEKPGSFFFVGGGNPAIQATYPHHHPMFDLDERSMLVTGQTFLALTLDYLTSGKMDAKDVQAKGEGEPSQ